MHGGHPRGGQLEVARVAAAGGAGGVVAVRDHVHLVGAAAETGGPLAAELLFVLVLLGGGGGAVLAAHVGHAEDGLPALQARLRHVAFGGRVAEAGGGEGAFGPAVVDAGEVPVDGVGGGVAVELVADVDEVLDGGDVDVIDGGEVEDDGFQGGFVGLDGGRLSATGPRIVPGAVLTHTLDAGGTRD